MTFGLWNVTPNKNGVLLGLNAGFTSGTLALGEVGLTAIYGGYALATANNITAFTNGVLGTTIFNAQIGYGAAPAMRFTPSAATMWLPTSRPTGPACRRLPPRRLSTINWSHDFDGKVIVPPGWAVFVTGSIAQTALFSMCLTWAEVPQ
jgi:hypothetical protein